jgi:uncharacterized protein YpmS
MSKPIPNLNLLAEQNYYRGKYEVEKKYNKWLLVILLSVIAIIAFLLVGSFVLSLTSKPIEVKNQNTNLQTNV